MMALWNNPRAKGVVIMVSTDMPPADSPNNVTLPGSPPNFAIFFCTHLSAAT